MAKKPSYEELVVKVEELEKELKKARFQSDHIRGEQAVDLYR
jgi:ribosomal protein L29